MPKLKKIAAVVILTTIAFSSLASEQWNFGRCKTDEIDNTKSCWAHGPTVPIPGPFPYKDRTASMHFGCGWYSEWSYVYFSSLNLASSELNSDGMYELRARFDNHEPTYVRFEKQKQGKDTLHFYGLKIIEKIRSHDKVLIEFPFYGESSKIVHFNLSGSMAAINEARKHCRSK